jgi:hypothetical protein
MCSRNWLRVSYCVGATSGLVLPWGLYQMGVTERGWLLVAGVVGAVVGWVAFVALLSKSGR